MNLQLARLTLVPSLALVAAQAFAQPAEPAASAWQTAAASVTPASGTATAAPAAVTVTATRYAAAGSVFHVADGVVIHAAYAHVMPPAAGFVYER